MSQALAPNDRNFLRPDQLTAATEEIKSLEDRLMSPHIQDKGEVRKQLIRVRKQTEEQAPKPPENTQEEERLVKRERLLRDEILAGMPSQEEMRKAPPGAVDKHAGWEKRNKLKILEWKNLQLRLRPGEREAANLERHRPTASTLNMDSAQIQGKNFFMPETTGPAVVFNTEQLAVLRQMSPQLADALALMSNPQRQEVKDAIAGIGMEESEASVAGKKGAEKKRTLSAEHKAAMKAGREAKKAAA